MNLRSCQLASILLVPLATIVTAPAKAQATDVYEYVEDRIYPVRAGLGIATMIQLDADDPVLDYSTGFSDGWELTRRGNVFYLKPRDIDVDTNMMVRTERHAYIFELKVVASDWTTLEQAKRAGVQYRIQFQYPPGAGGVAGTEPGADETAGTAPAPHTGMLNFEYEYATRSPGASLLPINVHDDGRFTYLRMAPSTEFPSGRFPAVFGRHAEDGTDFVVNTTVDGDTIVVHGTFPYLVLRHGTDVLGLRRSMP